jgi:high affinity Mn2+ porin
MNCRGAKVGLQSACLLLVFLAALGAASAQQSTQTTSDNSTPQTVQTSAPMSVDIDKGEKEESDQDAGNPVTMFPHSETSRYWISGQGNIIFQWHPSFRAKYTGPNSLTPDAQSATTHVLTLYTGYQLTHTTEVFADVEDATGGGIGTALGIAGYTNLDSVRTVQGIPLSKAPYLARLILRQIISLSADEAPEDRGPLALATSIPVRRIEFRFGKFDLVDFFDVNTWGSDTHLQFMNWTIDDNGAYDYAANTRGYTDGAIVEYDDHWFRARFAVTLMPKIANGINLDADVARARAENLELEARGDRFFHRPGVVRLLAYLNHGNMGNYEEAIRNAEKSHTTPDITSTRKQGRHKYGFGLNFEQELPGKIGVFGRLGWSDGRNESFAYTEVDRTFEFGGFTTGARWNRRNDRAGAAFVVNGIVKAHQQYLALGGLGFLLGDGALTYGREKIFEGFYTAHIWRGIFGSFDLQHINNPGYNKDRGPLVVPGLRLHVEF